MRNVIINKVNATIHGNSDQLLLRINLKITIKNNYKGKI